MDIFERGKKFLVINSEQEELTNQLRFARGQRFGRLLKKTYYSLFPQMKIMANQIIEEKGKLTLNDIIRMSILFNLYVKHCVDFLSDHQDPIISMSWEKLTSNYTSIHPNKWKEEMLDEMEKDLSSRY